MSLPIPSSAGPSGSSLDHKQLQALDGPLIALTQQCGGDLRRLMFAFFSFLHRRTDFYLVPHPDDVGSPSSMGFKEGDAEKLLIAAFRQFPLRRIPKGGGAKPAATTAGASTTPAKTKTTTTTTSKTASPPASPSAKVKESSSSSADNKTTLNAPTTKSGDKEEIGCMKGVLYNDKNGLQIPVGNGGSTKRYKWTQTIDECTVLVGVPIDLHGKDLDVTISSSSLSIKSKKPLSPDEDTPRIFVEGTLVEKVRPDESTWSVEGGVVIVILDKVKKTFWSTIIEGDPKIDTELVDSRRHISEYDEVTQAQIRKIIFDQEQYHKGLPSSDELLGKTSFVIPPLPPGVEYIDKTKLDEEEMKSKSSKENKQ